MAENKLSFQVKNLKKKTNGLNPTGKKEVSNKDTGEIN